MIKISPSILSADFANLERDIKKIEKANVPYVHIDVMDGHIVPNITFGSGICKAAARGPLPVDAHLMVEHPETQVENFAQAGAKIITIHAEAESQVTVLMDYAGEGEGQGLAAIQTKIYAEEGALVRLVQVQRLPKGVTCLNDVGGRCESGAKIEVTHLVLGGHATYQGCQIDLAGHNSALETDIGYLLEAGSKLDMNYNAIHRGKKTTSRIDASGVLKEAAFKLFRGTIDFKHGSAGSVGNEKEDVLLLDDTAINQTIPLILCAEEDVQGNHGATIGKLSEETLAYMAARGIPEETAYELMAKARIHRVCERIPDEATRQLVEQELEGGTDDE